ncbi:MAG: hypothetical protein HY902_03135 [Deltaproteobacteria bacterium]|nr:hypothetical protein [Deltaproteobacteria bacterium]
MRLLAPRSNSWKALLAASALILSAAAVGCGSDAKPGTDTTEENTDEQDTAVGDSSTDKDAPTTTDTKPSDSNVGPDGTVIDAEDSDAETPDELVGDADVDSADDVSTTADTSDTDAAAEVSKPTLPLPDCAIGSCAKCSFCATAPLCVGGVTYANDCEAICKLDLKEGLAPILDQVKKGACPECAACGTETIKCNTQTKHCVIIQNGVSTEKTTAACTKDTDCASAFVQCATLEDGTKVEIDSPCQATCLKLKQGITNPTPGLCKTSCSKPPTSCPTAKPSSAVPEVPVCAKEDGKTYATACALKNCALDGCYAEGETAATSACGAGLTKECDGACFADASKVSATAANCPKDCNAVCGVLPTGRGKSFRNECLATNAGAKVKDCAGITATEGDKCAADTLYTNRGCCADVNYTVGGIKQICAKKIDPKGGPELWVTFRNSNEFKCLAGTDATWEIQYSGPCLCQCSDVDKPVCGDNGQTYTNQCVAECYNKALMPNFTTKPGPCTP